MFYLMGATFNGNGQYGLSYANVWGESRFIPCPRHLVASAPLCWKW